MVDMEAIVRRQDRERCASTTSMINHYVARKAKVIEDHPHNADKCTSLKWRAASGAMIESFQTSNGIGFGALAWPPHGHCIATASGGAIQLWQAPS